MHMHTHTHTLTHISIPLCKYNQAPSRTQAPAGISGPKSLAGGKRTRVRVRPAWCDVHGPIARELANGDHPDAIEQMGGGGYGGYGSEGGLYHGPTESWGGDFGLLLDPEQQLRKRRAQLQNDEQKAVRPWVWWACGCTHAGSDSAQALGCGLERAAGRTVVTPPAGHFAVGAWCTKAADVLAELLRPTVYVCCCKVRSTGGLDDEGLRHIYSLPPRRQRMWQPAHAGMPCSGHAGHVRVRPPPPKSSAHCHTVRMWKAYGYVVVSAHCPALPVSLTQLLFTGP